jgi:hypothetical protein
MLRHWGAYEQEVKSLIPTGKENWWKLTEGSGQETLLVQQRGLYVTIVMASTEDLVGEIAQLLDEYQAPASVHVLPVYGQ